MLLRHNYFRNLEQRGTHADAEFFRKRDLKFLFNQAMEAYDQRINKLTASSDRGSCNPPLVFTPVGGVLEDVLFSPKQLRIFFDPYSLPATVSPKETKIK